MMLQNIEKYPNYGPEQAEKDVDKKLKKLIEKSGILIH